MNLEIGDVIELNDGEDYAIIKKIEVNKTIYLYLITTSTPTKTIIAKQINKDNEIIIETVSDKEELDYILYKISKQIEI